LTGIKVNSQIITKAVTVIPADFTLKKFFKLAKKLMFDWYNLTIIKFRTITKIDYRNR
jgi:hypothetical protein